MYVSLNDKMRTALIDMFYILCGCQACVLLQPPIEHIFPFSMLLRKANTQTDRKSINTKVITYTTCSSVRKGKGLATCYTCLYQVPPYVVLFFARPTHLAIAQLVERRTVVGNIKLTSLGRWFKSASRELFHFARTFLEKHLRPCRPKGMSSLLMQWAFI